MITKEKADSKINTIITYLEIKMKKEEENNKKIKVGFDTKKVEVGEVFLEIMSGGGSKEKMDKKKALENYANKTETTFSQKEIKKAIIDKDLSKN